MLKLQSSQSAMSHGATQITTHKGPDNVHLLGVGDFVQSQSQNTPREFQCWKPD